MQGTTAQQPVPAAPAGNFTILMDLRERATTCISGDSFVVGLAREVVSPSGRRLVRLHFGPAPLDCLWLPMSGVAYGTGSTSRVAVLDALTFDGMGLDA